MALSRRLVAADAYAVWHYDASTGRWGIVMSSGLSDEYQHSTIPVFDHTPSLPAWRRSSPRTSRIRRILGDRKEAYAREGIKALLIVPLRCAASDMGRSPFITAACTGLPRSRCASRPPFPIWPRPP